jgi:hypothetical protein
MFMAIENAIKSAESMYGLTAYKDLKF